MLQEPRWLAERDGLIRRHGNDVPTTDLREVNVCILRIRDIVVFTVWHAPKPSGPGSQLVLIPATGFAIMTTSTLRPYDSGAKLSA